MATAAARGLVIPDDLSIIGYNDIPVVSRLPVPLTTIREPFNHIARGAIDLLLDETPNHTGEVPHHRGHPHPHPPQIHRRTSNPLKAPTIKQGILDLPARAWQEAVTPGGQRMVCLPMTMVVHAPVGTSLRSNFEDLPDEWQVTQLDRADGD